jgi:hypothetical protein
MLKVLATIPFIVLASGEVQHPPAMQPVPAVSQATTVPIVPVTSSPDNDMTLQGYTGSSPCRPIFAEKAEPVGPVSGEVEKDSTGFMVIGTACR